MNESQKIKVLVIRFSSIGDIILTTPVIRNLHRAGYEVDLLTKPAFQNVLKDNPYLCNIYTLNRSLWSMAQTLRPNRYDVIIDLHKNIRSYLLQLFLFKKAIGYNKLRIKRWLRTKGVKSFSPDRHIADRFLDTLNYIDAKSDKEGLDFHIQEADKVDLPIQHDKRLKIALVPGAQHLTKAIPLQKLKDIVSQSAEDIHYYVLGGVSEMEVGQALNESNMVTDYCGALNLQQSASVIDQCDMVITTDTGLMHISAALKKPIIVIWGSTVPEFGFAPYLARAVNVENKSLKCRPCTKSGKSKCPYGHLKCMNEISTSQVLLAINELRLANHF